MNLENFVINGSQSVHTALKAIESNKHGMVFISCVGNSIKGIATDGDIRRFLINSGTLDDPISKCINKKFIWEKIGTPRELLLKKLDHKTRVIPLLDDDKRLVSIISRDFAPVVDEESIYARARSPVRISFAGGGSDLTHFFSGETSGAVINATIASYSHALLRIRDDQKITIKSMDLDATLEANTLDEALSAKGEFGLLQALLKLVSPNFGFELYLNSDFPIRSGLGGSAVVASAVLGCFNEFRRDQWDRYEIAELAYQAERHHLNISGGWQDQYASVFGGLNFMEFRMSQNIVHPLRVPDSTLLELEESLVLCSTGLSHQSGEIHKDQKREVRRANVRSILEENVKLSYQIRDELLRGRLREFGVLLDKAWQQKRRFSKKITSTVIDKIYEGAIANGALGGKLLGAGGGGFFLFYVPPYKKHQLLDFFKNQKLSYQSVRFEDRGLQSWKVRESKSHNTSELQQ